MLKGATNLYDLVQRRHCSHDVTVFIGMGSNWSRCGGNRTLWKLSDVFLKRPTTSLNISWLWH